MKLAVYGSLRKNLKGRSFRSSLVHGFGEFIGMGSFEGQMFALGHYPGVVPVSTHRVTAEVYEISEETLRRCDAFEGCVYGDRSASLFHRELTPVDVNGETVEAWVYFYSQSRTRLTSPCIESGDWSL